jgi:hypothetical protein
LLLEYKRVVSLQRDWQMGLSLQKTFSVRDDNYTFSAGEPVIRISRTRVVFRFVERPIEQENNELVKEEGIPTEMNGPASNEDVVFSGRSLPTPWPKAILIAIDGCNPRSQ